MYSGHTYVVRPQRWQQLPNTLHFTVVLPLPYRVDIADSYYFTLRYLPFTEGDLYRTALCHGYLVVTVPFMTVLYRDLQIPNVRGIWPTFQQPSRRF